MKKKAAAFILIPFLLFYALPAGAVEKEERKWQDETIYSIVIDRFNNGDSANDFKVDATDPNGFHGGDFQGIIDQLDYLKDMGFTVISLSPIFDNSDQGFHGYLVEDLTKTEEHFGDIHTFKKLVDEAHKRDIKVIVTYITNHFQENPEGKSSLLENAKWWIEETNVDGYRLGSVNQVPLDFWKDFVREVRSVKENFFLLAEVSSDDTGNIATYESAGFDGFVNTPLSASLRTAYSNTDQPMNSLFEGETGNSFLNGVLMDDISTTRFTREALENRLHPGTRWKLALAHLYTTPGIPIVFYGSEIALDGGAVPDNLRQMDFRADTELIDYITKLGELRQTLPSLTRGTIELLYEKDGMSVFKRIYEDEVTVIAINNTSETQNLTFNSEELEAGKELRGLLAGDLVRSNDEDEYHLVLEREEAEIYVLADKTGLNIPYLTVMGVVYAAFFGFIYLIWKRSRNKRKS